MKITASQLRMIIKEEMGPFVIRVLSNPPDWEMIEKETFSNENDAEVRYQELKDEYPLSQDYNVMMTHAGQFVKDAKGDMMSEMKSTAQLRKMIKEEVSKVIALNHKNS